jgi:hypothetical protein
MPDEVVTRGELDLLRQIVSANQARLEAMDANGTRGVAVVQSQLTDLIRDVTELRTEFRNEQRMRIASRRWALGIAMAGTGAIAALVTALVETLSHLHLHVAHQVAPDLLR